MEFYEERVNLSLINGDIVMIELLEKVIICGVSRSGKSLKGCWVGFDLDMDMDEDDLNVCWGDNKNLLCV